jgi:hypothetical protein
MWISDREKMEDTLEILSELYLENPAPDLAAAIKTLDAVIAEIKAYQLSRAYDEHLAAISRDPE